MCAFSNAASGLDHAVSKGMRSLHVGLNLHMPDTLHVKYATQGHCNVHKHASLTSLSSTVRGTSLWSQN